MSNSSDDTEVFHRGERRHRSPRSLVVTGFMIALAVVLIGVACSASQVRDQLIFGSIAAIVLCVTAQRLLRVVGGKVDRFQIDARGIRVNDARIRWNAIQYIGAYGFESSETVRLCYSRSRWISWRPFVHELPDEHPITRESYELLMEKLKQEMLPRFPKMRIGELLEPGGD